MRPVALNASIFNGAIGWVSLGLSNPKISNTLNFEVSLSLSRAGALGATGGSIGMTGSGAMGVDSASTLGG